MVRYLLNMKFCAGSEEPGDVDTGMYLFTPKDKNAKLISKVDMEELFAKTNKKCSVLIDEDEDDSDEEEFPFSYDTGDGLNLETLMDAFAHVTGGKVEEIQEELFLDNPGQIQYYSIEQMW